MSNQVVRVGNGFLLLFEEAMAVKQIREIVSVWQEHFPGVPVAVLPEARYANGGAFEFKGVSLTQEVADEFRRWWDEQAGLADSRD